jgi:hypothetical protein
VRDLDNHPAVASRIDAALQQFITEMQLGVHISLMRRWAPVYTGQSRVTYRPPGTGIWMNV